MTFCWHATEFYKRENQVIPLAQYRRLFKKNVVFRKLGNNFMIVQCIVRVGNTHWWYMQCPLISLCDISVLTLGNMVISLIVH
jgi:hypothetical protein